MQANQTADATEQKRLLDEADSLRNRVLALQRQDTAYRPSSPVAVPAPPPPPFQGFPESFEQTLARLRPLRVGGHVGMPTKVTDVKPAYPSEAQAARVQGVVILEAVIDEQGNIANARVLRSIPLLDSAALGAVSQWRYTPTLLNGGPVGVIVTVTVNFTIAE
jgi:protein TonB